MIIHACVENIENIQVWQPTFINPKYCFSFVGFVTLHTVMTRKSKNNKGNRRRWQLRIFKFILCLLVVALPCVWLIGDAACESEPMRLSREFANHLIHARYNEACALAPPQSVDDIAHYALWVGSQADEMAVADMRFKITHARLLMPADTINVVHGDVLIKDNAGEEILLHKLSLKMIYTIDGWLVDYVAPTSMW